MSLALLLALAYLVATVVAFRNADGASRRMNIALGAIVVADVAAAVGTPFGRFLPGPDQRMLLPVYSALPLFLAQWLSGLAAARAVALTAALLLVHLADTATRRRRPGRRRVPRASRSRGRDGGGAGADPGGPRARRAAPALRRRPVDAGHDVPLRGARDLLRSLPGDLPAVRARRGRGGSVGWWTRGPSPVLEANLAAVGVGYRYRQGGPLGGAYGDFTRPSPPLRELDAGRLRVTASDDARTAAG